MCCGVKHSVLVTRGGAVCTSTLHHLAAPALHLVPSSADHTSFLAVLCVMWVLQVLSWGDDAIVLGRLGSSSGGYAAAEAVSASKTAPVPGSASSSAEKPGRALSGRLGHGQLGGLSVVAPTPVPGFGGVSLPCCAPHSGSKQQPPYTQSNMPPAPRNRVALLVAAGADHSAVVCEDGRSVRSFNPLLHVALAFSFAC